MTWPAQVGRYRITGELGRGAMGVVLRGIDPALERPVAIKLIASRIGSSVSSQELEARFLREARVAARINHNGIVTVFDAGREGSSLYLVMELIEGEALADKLARDEYPEPAAALELVAQVAEALAVAHGLGVVHRDIKPANIMITRDGRVKVADFGVAKAMGEDTNLTRSGTVVGSPAYMAPEQVRGQELDGRSDLFSLGVVLYELLLRRKPFPSETVTTLIYQILHEDPLASPEISRSLGEETAVLLRRSLAKTPAERYPDGIAMAAAARSAALRLSQPAMAVQVTGPVVSAVAAAPAMAATGASSGVVPPPLPVTPALATGTRVAHSAMAAATGPSYEPVVPPPVAAAPPPSPEVPPVVPTMAASRPVPVAAPPRVESTSPTRAIDAAPQPPVPPPVAAGAARPAPRRSAAGVVMAVLGLALLAGAAFLVLRGVQRPGGGESTEPTPEAGSTPVVIAVATPTPEAYPIEVTAPTPLPTFTPTPEPEWRPTVPPTQVAIVWPTATVSPRATPTPFVMPTAPPRPTEPPIVATFTTRRGVDFKVSPEETVIVVDGHEIGIADDWDGMGGGKTYEFSRSGSHLVQLHLDGFQTAWIKVVVDPGASDEVVDVDTELGKAKKSKEKDKGKTKE